MQQSVLSGAAEQALGFTVAFGVLFLAGAIGAWMRAVISGTQRVVWGQRLLVDLIIGGCGGVLLPLFSPVVNRVLGIEFQTWTVAQQSIVALMTGGGGSWLWTAIAWRRGTIITPEEASTGTRPAPPAQGVIRGSKEAENEAKKFEATSGGTEPGTEPAPTP
jgi:hypothetical protein